MKMAALMLQAPRETTIEDKMNTCNLYELMLPQVPLKTTNYSSSLGSCTKTHHCQCRQPKKILNGKRSLGHCHVCYKPAVLLIFWWKIVCSTQVITMLDVTSKQKSKKQKTKKSSTSVSLAGNSGCLSWVRHSSCKSSMTHSCQCVQYFHVSRQLYGCQPLWFLTCAQVLMNVVAHRGCMDTIRVRDSESLLTLTEGWLGEKSLAAWGTWAHVSIVLGFPVGHTAK